jgi:hypothetical protein
MAMSIYDAYRLWVLKYGAAILQPIRVQDPD